MIIVQLAKLHEVFGKSHGNDRLHNCLDNFDDDNNGINNNNNNYNHRINDKLKLHDVNTNINTNNQSTFLFPKWCNITASGKKIVRNRWNNSNSDAMSPSKKKRKKNKKCDKKTNRNINKKEKSSSKDQQQESSQIGIGVTIPSKGNSSKRRSGSNTRSIGRPGGGFFESQSSASSVSENGNDNRATKLINTDEHRNNIDASNRSLRRGRGIGWQGGMR